MPTITDAKIARSLVLLDGVRTLKDSIIDREEFECEIPSEFTVMLGLFAKGKPAEAFSFSVDVLSHMFKPIWSNVEHIAIPDDGSNLEMYLKIPIPVLDIGPNYIVCKFDSAEVWRQRIFFARKIRRPNA